MFDVDKYTINQNNWKILSQIKVYENINESSQY